MSFTVDGNNVTVPLRRNMKPFDTGMAIITAIGNTAALAGYQADIHSAPRKFTPNATQSTPVDVTVMKPAPAGGGLREPAVVANAASTDRRSGGREAAEALQAIATFLNAQTKCP